jgi:hypothetical protein
VVDLPTMSVLVRGLDSWQLEHTEMIDEPRLLERVQHSVGDQVRALRTAPWNPQDVDDPWTRTGVPVGPFPRWLRCPRCHRLGPIDPAGQFELVHRWGRRPDLAKWVHSQCANQITTRAANRRACLPARFLVVCDAGHLDDFPYVEFVHRGRDQPCPGPKLVMRDNASTLGPRVTVQCSECGAARNIQEAAGRDGWENLPRCRGRHPHLQRFEQCGRPLRLMVLGASNLWFSVTASALHLPHDQTTAGIVAANWDILGSQTSADVVHLIVDATPKLRGLRDVPIAEVWAAIEATRGAGGPVPDERQGDLLRAEWKLLARPTTDRQDEDFRAVVTPNPQGYDALLYKGVLVPRLR